MATDERSESDGEHCAETVPKPGKSTILRFDTDTIPREPVAQEQLKNGPEDPKSWLMYGDGYRRHHHTVADIITPDNVNSLDVEWVIDVKDPNKGMQGSPLIVPGDPPVMYQTNGPDETRAIDARDGNVLWQHDYDPKADVNRETPKGREGPPASRGLAVLGDTLYKSTLDYGLLALNRYTADERWYYNGANVYRGERASGDPDTAMHPELLFLRKRTEASSYPPIVYDNTVLKGSFGGEWGVSGWMEGITTDGEQAWHFRTVPQKYWIGDSWKHGGGAVWQAPAIDPETNTAVIPVGNPGPWNGVVRPGYNWYTAGKVALDVSSGEHRWHYQESPHDWWDYDSPSPAFIYDAEIDGETRTLASWPGKTGWVFTVDVESGKLINRSDEFVEHLNTFTLPAPTFEGMDWIMPHLTGGTDPQPSSFDSERRIMVLKARNQPMKLKRSPPIEYSPNEPYIGLKDKSAKPKMRDQIPDWNQPLGNISALDPVSGDVLWQNWVDTPPFGGVLTTTTGLTFAGLPSGYLVAYDTETGEELWKHEVGPGVDGNPISWFDPGTQKQYVAVGAAGSHGGPNPNKIAAFSLEAP